jgi:thiol:disulfide interchange protein DsbA
MKQLKQALLTLSTLLTFSFIAFSSQATDFKEGKHYIVVSEQTTNKPELSEYFSYYCPTCRAYEPYMSGFKKVIPTGGKLNKVHVDFMGHTTPEIQFMLAKALIVAEKSGFDKKFSSAVFKYLQTDRAKFDSTKDIRNIFVLSGGDGNAFDKGIKNFSVVSKAKANKKTQDKLSAARHMTGVPTMVVNGKYLINSKALDSKRFFDEYKELVAYLFTL